MKKILLLILAALMASSYACAEKMRVAVLDLQPKNASPDLALAVSDYIRVEMVKYDTYELLDRDNMNVILKEQAFQQSGCTSAECAVEIGQLLNCQKMFVGSLSKIGSTFFLTMQRVDVETAKVDYADSVEAKNEDGLVRAAAELSSGMAIGKVEKEKRHKFFTGSKRSWRIELGGARPSLGSMELFLDGVDSGEKLVSSGLGAHVGFRYCPEWMSWYTLSGNLGINDMPIETEVLRENVIHNSTSYKVSYRGYVEEVISLEGRLYVDLSDKLGLKPQRVRLMGGFGFMMIGMYVDTIIINPAQIEFNERTQLETREEANLIFETIGIAASLWKFEFLLAVRFHNGDLSLFSDSLDEGMAFNPEMADFPLATRELLLPAGRSTLMALSLLL